MLFAHAGEGSNVSVHFAGGKGDYSSYTSADGNNYSNVFDLVGSMLDDSGNVPYWEFFNCVRMAYKIEIDAENDPYTIWGKTKDRIEYNGCMDTYVNPKDAAKDLGFKYNEEYSTY